MKIMLSPGAIAPTRGSSGAAGYDLVLIPFNSWNYFEVSR